MVVFSGIAVSLSPKQQTRFAAFMPKYSMLSEEQFETPISQLTRKQ